MGAALGVVHFACRYFIDFFMHYLKLNFFKLKIYGQFQRYEFGYSNCLRKNVVTPIVRDYSFTQYHIEEGATQT